jgi:hypothetical protein
VHTITTRTTTPEEQRQIKASSGPDYASYGCFTVLFIMGGIGLGLVGGWIGGLVSPEAKTYGTIVGWSIAVAWWMWMVVAFVPFERRLRQRAKLDCDAHVVQVIQVRDPRVVEIGLINDNEPILAFDIGDNKILFLQGQWLLDPQTYGASSPEEDASEEFVNGLPAPHSFPSSRFSISRFPHSGDVIEIQVEGEYRRPEQVVEALQPEFEFGCSELFEGSLDQIAQLLVEEHRRLQHRQ